MNLCCQQDARRDAVRRREGWNGLDYLEVDETQQTLFIYFLGQLPAELAKPGPGLETYLTIEGGQRVTNIQITGVTPKPSNDPEKDDFLIVNLDRYGDFSTYTLRLVNLQNIDPRYDHLEFSFKIDCPSDLDCATACTCAPTITEEPEINYLAKDYASFRQLILDRLALLVPDWTERHVPDLGIALVEVLAYTGDYLSYYQDSAGTEAYLETARQRISVRRHARLVDYVLSEGCNARCWVCVEVTEDTSLLPADIAFVTMITGEPALAKAVFNRDDLRPIVSSAYEVFEPLVPDPSSDFPLRQAHNEIAFYTWGNRQCCLAKGSTSAALLDHWTAGGSSNNPDAPSLRESTSQRALQLKPGDVLIFEEVIGPGTGVIADADPRRRQAVRLIRVTQGEDPVIRTPDDRPTPYVIIEWGPEDALDFSFCISTIGPAPACKYIENISVARGNVLLVDHGQTVGEPLGSVPVLSQDAVCECEDHPGDVQVIPGKFTPKLSRTPLTFSAPLPKDHLEKTEWVSAAACMVQDVQLALPQVWLDAVPTAAWTARYDLIESGPEDLHFVVEIDNDGVAHLRFGDGDLGSQPPAGSTFAGRYRVGNGIRGNVGPESITALLFNKDRPAGIGRLRNPLSAQGGVEPEPIAEAKLYAPHLFRKQIERAVTAEDYAALAERNSKIQRASARLVWTGSWYEADVAVDPLGSEQADQALLRLLQHFLYPFRRMGHDLRVIPARYVKVELSMQICALPGYLRGQIKSELLALFSDRVLPNGKLGFFHPDNLTFGEGIYLSQIVAAAQAVPGVGSVKISKLHRLFEGPNHELENGLLPLRTDEIPQLDNDPNYPEHGHLEIQVGGGR